MMNGETKELPQQNYQVLPMRKVEQPNKAIVSRGKITKFEASKIRIDPNNGRFAY